MELFQEPFKPLPEYPGRKAAAGAWQKILSNIPRCELFIEAMAGSAYISSLVKESCQTIVNDIDKKVIDKIQTATENIEFFNLDYQAIIQRFDNGSPGRVFYFDPPYLKETRSYQKPIYRFPWEDDTEHNRFLKAATAMKSPAMISHYPCPLYDKALKKWRKITYNSMTRAGIREESLYMNFPQPVLLQFPGHVGDNFTDRQRIKRKVDRLVKRLTNEPEHERAAILSTIIEKFSYIAPAE